ncbi:hypothetical protein PHABIO_464 [Pseudomonas phage Phabio]|uniref:Uncharacterized protein n=1 Tax=Pseudomonas phage Phabio TaxID=2006668 RepID=A0A1Y0SUB6_9CAUD|nr:hypothetical protein MZD05_gp455 [Pseudomonas phage Phabio]ARV77092.1 hypothetical protein PHABIO_464 [Pseudomonas phage Phabio]
MPVIREIAPGEWVNEDDIPVRLNRNWLTGGMITSITSGLVVPDTAVWVEEENSYREEMYVIYSTNAYEIGTVLHSRPPSEGIEAIEEYVKELTVIPAFYPYFVYLLPTEQGAAIQTPFEDYYREPEDTTE